MSLATSVPKPPSATLIVAVGPNKDIITGIKRDVLAAKVPCFAKTPPAVYFPEYDKNTFYTLFCWVLHNTVPPLKPKLTASEDILEFWEWNPFKLYNLAVKLKVDKLQDFVMTKLIQGMREKQQAGKQEWELQEYSKSIDENGVYQTYHLEQDPKWAPNFPTIKMLRAIHNFAPRNSKMQEFADRFMAHILLERYQDDERDGDWSLNNMVDTLHKDKEFLKGSLRVIGMYHCYRDLRPDWELGSKPSPLAWGGECYYHVHGWLAGGPCEHSG